MDEVKKGIDFIGVSVGAPGGVVGIQVTTDKGFPIMSTNLTCDIDKERFVLYEVRVWSWERIYTEGVKLNSREPRFKRISNFESMTREVY